MTNEITYNLNVANKTEFFKAFINLLQPIINVRPKEVEFLAVLLKYRNEISKALTDEDEIAAVLFSTKKRKEMRDELNMDEFAFNTILYDLRRKNLISKNIINKKIIPTVSDSMKQFNLNFKINVTQ